MSFWDEFSRNVEKATGGVSTIVGNGLGSFFNDVGRNMPQFPNLSIDNPGGRDSNYYNDLLAEEAGLRPRGSADAPRNSYPGSGDNALAALKGAYNSPSVNGVPENIPSMLMRPDPVDEQLMADKARAEQIRQLMEDLQMGTDNTGLVDEAFAGSLAAIEKARQSAQNNYQESDKAIAGLTQGHVNEIKTVDRKAVQDNAAEYSGDLTENYTGAKETLAADQKAELNARTEMLKRLGIQEAGLGEAGQEQSKAITRLTENNANEQSRASTYKAADLTRNTELAAAQATEGVERQSDLRRQLDGINADLDRNVASVENSKAQARISATNADREAFLKQLQFYSDELASINEGITSREDKAYDRAFQEREFNAKNAPRATGGALDIASQQLRAQGFEPAEYADAYAQSVAENSYDSRSGKDKIADTVAKMRAKNKNLDPQVALRYVMAVENFGTDKGNTPIG